MGGVGGIATGVRVLETAEGEAGLGVDGDVVTVSISDLSVFAASSSREALLSLFRFVGVDEHIPCVSVDGAVTSGAGGSEDDSFSVMVL